MNSLCFINSLQTSIILVSTNPYYFRSGLSPMTTSSNNLFLLPRLWQKSGHIKEIICGKICQGIYIVLGFQSCVVQLFLPPVCNLFFCIVHWNLDVFCRDNISESTEFLICCSYVFVANIFLCQAEWLNCRLNILQIANHNFVLLLMNFSFSEGKRGSFSPTVTSFQHTESSEVENHD